MTELKALAKEIGSLNDSESHDFAHDLHEFDNIIKNQVYNSTNIESYPNNEQGWTSQSMIFAIDIIPYFHKILKKYYERKDELGLLDVGGGSCAGTNLIAYLHSSNFIYSKISVDSIDINPFAKRWVLSQYPLINYFVGDIKIFPDKTYDFVLCSHCIEHIPAWEEFLAGLVRLCRGFVFVYAPYNESDRIPGHVNRITKATFNGYNIEMMEIIQSMAWHPDISEDKCILAVLDARN